MVKPVLETLSEDGIPYVGFIYAGLVLTPDGPKVLEFNCRLGDPETQAILPTLDSDLLELIVACIDGTTSDVAPRWNLSLIHISEPTRRTPISYAVFCLKKKKT